MSTKSYACEKSKIPGWMHLLPIEPLTAAQWRVAIDICAGSNGAFASELATRAGVSESTARKALKKMVAMGLIRRSYEGRYWRKVWAP